MPIELAEREREEDVIALPSDQPKINALKEQVNCALADLSGLYDRWGNCYDYWHSRWDGQTVDGCKHAPEDALDDPFPWEGGSDTRIRLEERYVREHVRVAKLIWYHARLQAEAIDWASHGREASQGTQLLKWMIRTQMAENVRREVPLALNWRFAYGATLLAVEWVQDERLDDRELTPEVISLFLQAFGGGGVAAAPGATVPGAPLGMVLATLPDDRWTERYLDLFQRMSDVVSRSDARTILNDLRATGKAMMPVRYTYKSAPRWMAKRVGIDVLFPVETRDFQAAPWVADREWVDRTELVARIRTRGYDPAFVQELLKHKGETNNALWTGRTFGERAMLIDGTAWYGGSGMPGWSGAFRDLYELYHIRYRVTENRSTCLYQTTFNPLAVGDDREKPLYAAHGKFNYDHGLYPYVVMRMEHPDPEIVSSEGVPEKCYSWAQEIKKQADGRTDLTALELGPPLIVPKARSRTLEYPLPRAVLGVDTARDYQFMQLPPPSVRSIEIENRVEARAREFFPLFGADLDPDLKQTYREELAMDILGEFSEAADQTFKLAQQFETDDEVTAIVGQLRRPFKVSRQEIVRAHIVTASYNTKLLSQDYAVQTIPLFLQALQINQTGQYDMGELARAALEILDPSLADRVSRPMPEATQMEQRDELSAINAAFNGIEIPPPMSGNHQLRLQTLVGATFQSPNPEMGRRLAQNQDTQEILKRRMQFYLNQIQQYQQNPQIGRTLAVSAFNPRQALPTTAQPTRAGY